jgi:hypothetical protein
LGTGEDRADAHLVGLAAGHGEAEEATQRLQALALGVGLADHRAGTGAVAELAGVAGGDHAARHRRADVLDRLVGRAFAQALVGTAGHFLGAQAQHLVGHAGGHGDGTI